MPVERLLRSIQARDLALFRRAALSHAPLLDRTLPKLTRAANNSILWMAIGAVLWLLRERASRRAAARGLVSIAISSAIANGPAKLLSRRTRPLLDDVPAIRQLSRLPRSTSFPSGHSASAFAFAVGVTLELPVAGALLGPLATAVAFSRIYTGVHYPSDVLAGAILGTSVALATRSFWPAAPQRPAQSRLTATHEAAPHPNGEGVTIVVNAAAGSSWSGALSGDLEESLPDARVIELSEDGADELEDVLERTVDAADVVGVSGGDGSINCAARVALENKKPLLVIPGGTLNHLARDIGVKDLGTAVRALEEGRALALDVATIDGRPFLNAASFGAYPELVDARERLESKIGKWPAMLFALARVLRRGTPLDVEIDGGSRRIWMIFIGNCRYHPSGFAPAWRERLDDGHLDVRIVDAAAPLARVRLVASILTGRLGRSRIYEQRLADNLKVRSLNGPMRLACDGETFDGSEEFVVEKLSDPLTVYAPVD